MPVRTLACVLMAVLAVRLPKRSRVRHAAHNVFSWRHDLQVMRIHASAVTAQVIQMNTSSHRAILRHEGPPMSGNGLISDTERPIAVT